MTRTGSNEGVEREPERDGVVGGDATGPVTGRGHGEVEAEGFGPRSNAYWCCSCGVWRTDDNGMERCPVSHVKMQTMGVEGLSHLWAGWNHDRAMRIWERDADIRAGLR